MRLLAATDFALRTLVRLAASPSRLASTDVLAREIGVPRNHVHKVVQSLSEAGFVATTRGNGGGVRLARPAESVTLGEVVRWFERDQAMVECFRADGGACPLDVRCRLKKALGSAGERYFEELDRTTLAECAGIA
ncbi:MAG: Rrf2 family transcriptional regulator [Myxococcales bacterium]|nr:Rrf2 family transcriptional regulator [Myxococcales bacterium]